MCHEATGRSYDRPLMPEDVSLIAAHFPQIDREAIDAVYRAITDHHWPQPAVLVAVLEMIDRARRYDTGYYQYPTMPFSAMDLESYERVQSEGMYAFHAVFESMALAQRNMLLLNNALKTHFGLQLVLFCDCGCSIVPAAIDPFETDWYQKINTLRSLAEAVGTKVVRVADFADPDWVRRQAECGLDMGPAETASYTKMYAILQTLSPRAINLRQLASPEFSALFTEAV